ncbi:hypothetical protein DCMF_08570 [Candidatus Formimonas warabiya]|uniref:Uncharacterized protein n=1 Tax=Formimonas warabiya TaxID=1761012 RepID=A0A3G1KQT7_FORW1|nr:hypothetical protein DCMF_08570 [Candidatus Formimonas warabiya]
MPRLIILGGRAILSWTKILFKKPRRNLKAKIAAQILLLNHSPILSILYHLLIPIFQARFFSLYSILCLFLGKKPWFYRVKKCLYFAFLLN